MIKREQTHPHTYKCVKRDLCDDLTIGKHYVSYLVPHFVYGKIEEIIDDAGDERDVYHLHSLVGTIKRVPALKSKFHQRKEMEQKFIDFLKEKKAFHAFVVNLARIELTEYAKKHGVHKIRTLSNLCELIPYRDWTVSSFLWDETTEGYGYWYQLHIDWIN